MPSDDKEVRDIIIKAMHGELTERELATIGLSDETKRAIKRAIEASPALEAAILNLVDLAYADGVTSAIDDDALANALLRAQADDEPDPELDVCIICHKMHDVKDIVNLGVGMDIDIGSLILIPGHEYIIETQTTQQKFPREWRMGFMGASGYYLQFSARGPDRTHGGQYGGTETIDRRQIVGVQEVERNDAKRHVGKPMR
jgi:hypothetical protein